MQIADGLQGATSGHHARGNHHFKGDGIPDELINLADVEQGLWIRNELQYVSGDIRAETKSLVITCTHPLILNTLFSDLIAQPLITAAFTGVILNDTFSLTRSIKTSNLCFILTCQKTHHIREQAYLVRILK
jgi:hypothetical protein